jgi:hypothetical protein
MWTNPQFLGIRSLTDRPTGFGDAREANPKLRCELSKRIKKKQCISVYFCNFTSKCLANHVKPCKTTYQMRSEKGSSQHNHQRKNDLIGKDWRKVFI